MVGLMHKGYDVFQKNKNSAVFCFWALEYVKVFKGSGWDMIGDWIGARTYFGVQNIWLNKDGKILV